MRLHHPRATPLGTILLGLAVLAIAPAARAEDSAPAAAPAPRLFDNLGSYHRPISTKDPMAQRWFDQGLALLYGFNHDEARRSFEEAARLDPNCAICWWGASIVLGPNINLPADPEASKAAFQALGKAVALRQHASPVERDLIDALGKRYVEVPPEDRKSLDEAYAAAMRGVAHRHPKDPDVQALFAESLMDLRPWDLWTQDGKPQPGTEEIVATLEHTLAANPDHPGANHYYIHTIEASPHPEKALPSAQRLAKLIPGAGHLVHMPAHVYQRVGRYGDAALANRAGADADRAYFQTIGNPEGVYPLMYYNHNLQFGAVSFAFDGQSAAALTDAKALSANVTPEIVRAMPMAEFAVPIETFVRVRFGRWDEVLAAPAPPDDFHYVTALWHWARGRSLDAKGNVEGARAELSALQSIADQFPADLLEGLNAGKSTLQVACHDLAGDIALHNGKTDEAIAELTKSVEAEDALKYDEPADWPLPARHSLGAALLQAGRAADAEKVYRADLTRNPENGWALFGLAQSLRAERKENEAKAVDARFAKAWARADVTLTASRF